MTLPCDLHDLINSDKVTHRVGEICSISTGKQLNREYMGDEGPIPVINGGIEPSGYVDKSNQTAGKITISQGGNSAGFVNYIDVPFWAGAHCYVVTDVCDIVDYRYLYHFLKTKENYFMSARQGAGIPGLKKSIILDVKIPIPRISVQKRIAAILDSFVELNGILKKELEIRQDLYNTCSSLLYDCSGNEVE